MTDGAQQEQSNLKFKILTYIFLLLAISLAGLYVAPYFINIEQYRENIIAKITSVTEKKAVINGKLSLSVNPFLDNAKISISNIALNNADESNFIAAKNLEINVALYELIFGRNNITSIKLYDADINLDSWREKNQQQVLSKDAYEIFPYLRQLTIENSSINYGMSRYSQVFLVADLSRDGEIRLKGDAVDDNKKIIFLANTSSYLENQKRTLAADLKKNGNQLHFDGSFSNNDQFTFFGLVKASLVQPIILKKEVAAIFPFLSNIANDELLEHIDASYDLSIVGSDVALKNIKIISKKINGAGEINFSLSESTNLIINLNFDNIDLSNFLKLIAIDSQKTNQDADMAKDYIASALQYEQKNYIDLAPLEQNIIDINIAAKEIAAPNFLIQDFDFKFKANNGQLDQSEISFKTSSGNSSSSVKMDNLSFKKVGDVNIILGDFSSIGNNIDETLKLINLQQYVTINDEKHNYALTSQIILAPKEISLFNIIGTIGTNGIFSGSIATKQEKLTDYNFDLKFKNLTFANFDLPLLRSRAYALLTKSHEDDYLSYFRWFRLLSSTYNIKLEFDNTEFKGEKITNLIAQCELEPGSMSMAGHIESDAVNADLDLTLTAQALKPKLSININGENLNFNRMENLFFGFLNSDNGITKQEPTPVVADLIWSDQAIGLFKIQKYATQVNFDLKNLQLGSQLIKDFKLAGHTSNDIFYLDNIYLGMDKGQLQARGNISFFEPPLYQFSFTGNGLEVEDILAMLMPNFNSIEGATSTTGSVITQGKSPMDLVKNLNATASFSASQLTLHGINANEVVDIALKRKAYATNKVLENLSNALNSGDTIIMGVSGNITAKGGIFETKNTSFKSRFTGAACAVSLDLNNMTISSNTEFLFTPSANTNTVSYSILQSGSMLKDIPKQVRDNALVEFVMKQYVIKLHKSEPLVESPPLSNQQILEQDSKSYLYHKLENTDINTRP